MPRMRRHARWAAVALATTAFAACNGVRLRNAGLLDEPYRPCLGPPRLTSCGPTAYPARAPNPCGLVGVEEYVPVVPVADSRAAMTSLILAPSPWLLTQGDPLTPERGRATLRWQRIDDERDLTDFDGNSWFSDGEIQAISLEVVSPKIRFQPSRCAPPFCFHVGASIHAYTLSTALFDGLRNFVEEDLAGNSVLVEEQHDIGGRELSLNGEDLLESPLWKVRGTLKVPLPDLPMATTRLQGSFSVGVTSPAFGASKDSGNSAAQVDATLAFALPLSRHFRIVGGGSLVFPGSAQAYEDVGLDHEKSVGSARVGLEWWTSRRFAAMVGFSYYGHYTTNSGLPTDHDSTFIDIGFLWRIDDQWDVHLFGGENPQGFILTEPGSDFTDSQKDADFTIGLGVGWTL